MERDRGRKKGSRIEKDKQIWKEKVRQRWKVKERRMEPERNKGYEEKD